MPGRHGPLRALPPQENDVGRQVIRLLPAKVHVHSGVWTKDQIGQGLGSKISSFCNLIERAGNLIVFDVASEPRYDKAHIGSGQSFAKRNGITAPPVPGKLPKGSSDKIASVETLTWQTNGKPVSCLYTVRGGGHVIPQQTYRFPRLLGKTTSDLNAPREAIGFFEHESQSL